MIQVPKSHKTGIFAQQVLIFIAFGFQQFNIYNEKLPLFFFLGGNIVMTVAFILAYYWALRV